MTTAIAEKANESKRDILTFIQSDKVKNQMAMVLPKYLTADRMARIACTSILKTPKLTSCTPESLLNCLMLCSQAGLEPDGRNAHLIPYGDVCQVIFDWKGLVLLAKRNKVANIAAEIVCEKDVFEWTRTGDGLQFKHQIDYKQPRGQMYAAYCIWKDGKQFDGEVMQKSEIDGIRQRSRASSSGPWVTDYNEMAKKTVVRRASKKWPLDPEVAAAINGDSDTIDVDAVVRTTSAPTMFAAGSQTQQLPPVSQPAPADPLPPIVVVTKLDELRKLIEKGEVKEASVIKYLRETGLADDSLATLDDIFNVKASAIENLVASWKKALPAVKQIEGLKA